MRRILFIALLVAGSVGFDLFVNWYDTGQWSSSASMPAAISALALAALAVLAAPRLTDRWIPMLFWVAVSTLVIVLSFGVGSGLNDGLFSILIVALVYLPMSLPFGLVIGLVGSWLLNSRDRSSTANEI